LEELDAKIAAFKAMADELTRAFAYKLLGGGFKDSEEYKSQA